MHFSKVLNVKVVLLVPLGFLGNQIIFLRFILVPIHFSASPSNFNGSLRNLNTIPKKF